MLTSSDAVTGTKGEFESITARIRTRAHARRAIIEAVIVAVLVVGGSLLAWGGGFATNMVHDQLADQKISFPAKGSPALDPKTYPGLQQYGGQAVDSGPKAKAYANEYIKVHLAGIAGGKTYSQVSEESRANPDDAKLAGQVQSLFRGETLRGLLLYAWGWSVVGMLATIVSWAAFAGAAVVLLALLYGLSRPQHS
ncbi:MAG: hypothetical protein JWN67_3464 [Actinomycetia bacterium]|nr:hypothetical protein [Actinomycetes bacterium]